MISPNPKTLSEDDIARMDKADIVAYFSLLIESQEERIAQVVSEYEAKKQALYESILIERARYFGPRSEHISPGQIPLFNDAEAACDEGAPEPGYDSVARPKSRGRRRAGLREQSMGHLPVEVIDHDLAPDERRCGCCGSELKEMKVEVTKKLKVIPTSFICEEHHRHVYVCGCCSKENASGATTPAVIIRSPVPASPIAKSIATPSLLAALINEKYVNSKPLARIEADFVRAGNVAIPRSTLSNWMIKASDRWFAQIYDRMKDDLLQRDVLHADETVVQVLKEPDRRPVSKSYMWVWCTAEGDVPITLFKYSPSRSRSVPEGFLGGWQGYLHADGYEVYHGLKAGVTVVGCLAHVRRYFTDIVKGLGKEAKGSTAAEAVRQLDNIFHVEHGFAGLDAAERYQMRLKQLKPLVDDFYDWLKEKRSQALHGYSLSKAITYAFNQRPYVENVFLDGRLALSNNRAERAIRPFAVGRRNWLFSDTPKGAKASAVLFSVTQTALACGLKPFEYLTWVLSELPNTDLDPDLGHIARFTPYSSDIPDYCYLKPGDRPILPDEDAMAALPKGMDIDDLDYLVRQLEEPLIPDNM
jgi:transposase